MQLVVNFATCLVVMSVNSDVFMSDALNVETLWYFTDSAVIDNSAFPQVL